MPHDPHTTQKNVLTIAHINHREDDMREENLVCLCAPCHIAYDAQRKALETLAKGRIKRARKRTEKLLSME